LPEIRLKKNLLINTITVSARHATVKQHNWEGSSGREFKQGLNRSIHWRGALRRSAAFTEKIRCRGSVSGLLNFQAAIAA
jgi:hypothetical protein